jgi:serine-type D-Ala-D-Ala carboxypeptidase (penicillin-binding protein 5/6)
VSKSPFLPQGGSSRRARAMAKRRRRRRRALAIGAIAIVIAAAAAVLALSRSSISHGSASGSPAGETRRDDRGGSGKRGGRAAASISPTTSSTANSSPSHATHSTMPAPSRTGLALGRPPLALDLSGAGDLVQVAFHHEPRAGLLFDLDTGRVLWQREATRVLPIASLTKMMTALLEVRSRPPDTPVPISRRAVDAQGSKVGLLPLHKHVSSETLLYGLLLPSGNDAAVALAENVAGSVSRFVDAMNEEAAKLGLGCTRYTSPDGLDNGNVSCAADLAELAHVDLEQPRLAAITRSASAIRPFPIKGGKLYLYNNNPLLRYGYPGATGLKTGETEAAGLCLVGTAERRGVRLGVVLLHSPELGRQAEYLLNRGFEDVYGQAPIPAPPVPVGR